METTQKAIFMVGLTFILKPRLRSNNNATSWFPLSQGRTTIRNYAKLNRQSTRLRNKNKFLQAFIKKILNRLANIT